MTNKLRAMDGIGHFMGPFYAHWLSIAMNGCVYDDDNDFDAEVEFASSMR